MRKQLLRLANERKDGTSLGHLGPATFTPVDSFFKRTQADQRLVHTLHTRGKVFAVGDIHGDLLALLSVLFIAGLIDTEAQWIGGSTILVQCGDILDRDGRDETSISTTPNLREEVDIFQYLHALNLQARKVGGHVIAVLGNHEIGTVYNLDGYKRFQSSPQVQGWGGLEHKQTLFKTTVAHYLANHNPLILRINDFYFVHGGYQGGHPHLVTETAAALKSYQALSDAATFVITDRSGSCSTSVGADGIVLGHTVVKQVQGSCNGKVWHVDVALSEAFGERDLIGGLSIDFSQLHPMVKTLNYSNNTLESLYYLNGRLVAEKRVIYHGGENIRI